MDELRVWDGSSVELLCEHSGTLRLLFRKYPQPLASQFTTFRFLLDYKWSLPEPLPENLDLSLQTGIPWHERQTRGDHCIRFLPTLIPHGPQACLRGSEAFAWFPIPHLWVSTLTELFIIFPVYKFTKRLPSPNGNAKDEWLRLLLSH